MRVAIVPPEYFPGQAVAALMASVDLVVLADTFQYVRQSRQNRARLRTPDGTQWITVPLLRGQYRKSIMDSRIDHSHAWADKHLKSLQFNYGASPYFEHYMTSIRRVLSSPGPSMADLSVPSTDLLCELVGCTARRIRASDLEGHPADVRSIRAALGGGTLVIPDDEPMADHGDMSDWIPFRFTGPSYRQQFPGFEPDCSVIDLLMLHGPAARSMLLDGVATGG